MRSRNSVTVTNHDAIARYTSGSLATPAMRVRVVVAVVAHHDALVLQVPDDLRVGIEHVLADPVADLGGVLAVLVHRAHRGDADRVAGDLVVLAEARRHVHDAGAVLGRHEVAGQHLKRVRGVGEVVEQRLVPATDQVGTL